METHQMELHTLMKNQINTRAVHARKRKQRNLCPDQHIEDTSTPVDECLKTEQKQRYHRTMLLNCGGRAGER